MENITKENNLNSVTTGPTLNDVYQNFINLKQQIKALVEQQKRMEQQLLGRVITCDPRMHVSRAYEGNLLDALFLKAQSHFGYGGMPLTIDKKHFYQICSIDINKETPDFNLIWQTLEEHFGNGKSKSIICKQSSNRLLSKLQTVYKPEDINQVQIMLFDLPIKSKVVSGNKEEVTYEILYLLSFIDMISALALVAEVEGLNTTANQIHLLKEMFESASFQFKTRAKFETEHITFTFYREKVRCQLTETFAEKLKIFISEYSELG